MNKEKLKEKETAKRQKQMMKTLGEIASGVGHEFKTPLGTIQLQMGLIRRLMKNTSNQEKLEECLQVSERQIDRMNRLIQKIQQLAKGDKEKKEALEINSIIQSSLGLLRGQLQDHYIEITFEEGKSSLPVFGNQPSLEGVILNLLVNAKEALEETNRPDKKIQIQSNSQSEKGVEQVIITIQDNGAGIPKEIQKNLFQPFHSGKKTGMGLGLSIAKQTIEDMRGELSLLHSNESSGTLFEIKLPSYHLLDQN